MKYLIQNRKEFAITVGLFIMQIINLIRAIRAGEALTEEIIVAVLTAFFSVLAWFYNMPTSKENCEATGSMRLAKQQNKGVITGEDFTDEAEEVQEED